MNHFTLDSIGSIRAQNDTTEPCIATTGTGYFVNFGIVSVVNSFCALTLTSHDVLQQPYSDAIIQMYEPEFAFKGLQIRKAIMPSP